MDAASVTIRIRGVVRGSLISIQPPKTSLSHVEAQTIRGDEVICAPLDSIRDVTVGSKACATGGVVGSFCGTGMQGRCVDAWGRPDHQDCIAVRCPPSVPMESRRPISTPLWTGIVAIDALCTLGIGQRIALFSGAGVGKSTLLRQIAERAHLDAQVVALVGERGREAAEAVNALKGSARWQTTTVVCATADAPPQERLAAAYTALAQAEWLCGRGNDVLLTFDSLTRVAQAWRELALACGEPPAHRGHPASMVGVLASIAERAGVRKHGSITAVFAVLVDADDPYEPVTDVVRGLLDGHIVLSRKLADAGRFPPIDVLRSNSRLMQRVAAKQHCEDAAVVRQALAALERAEDLFAIGAYVAGGDPYLDAAVRHRREIEDCIFQGSANAPDPRGTLARLAANFRASLP